jgi:hypothetical protein
MDYRSILKNQLEQRKIINPRFSMRSLAQKIELSPSKLSEISPRFADFKDLDGNIWGIEET